MTAQHQQQQQQQQQRTQPTIASTPINVPSGAAHALAQIAQKSSQQLQQQTQQQHHRASTVTTSSTAPHSSTHHSASNVSASAASNQQQPAQLVSIKYLISGIYQIPDILLNSLIFRIILRYSDKSYSKSA